MPLKRVRGTDGKDRAGDIILISWDSVKSEMIFEIKARLDEEIVNLTRTFDEVRMKDLLK